VPTKSNPPLLAVLKKAIRKGRLFCLRGIFAGKAKLLIFL
jgi:hypothetical protein